MITITDERALPLIVEAELFDGFGAHDSRGWRDAYNRYRQHLEETWSGIVRVWQAWRQARVADGDPTPGWDNAQTPTGVVIYGVTGSTRWLVRGNGEIEFSVRHAYPESELGAKKIARAKRLGFGIAT